VPRAKKKAETRKKFARTEMLTISSIISYLQFGAGALMLLGLRLQVSGHSGSLVLSDI
jgi:hypothetical protein